MAGLLLVTYFGVFSQWARLGWEYHVLRGEEQSEVQLHGGALVAEDSLDAWVHQQRWMSSGAKGLQGDFVHLSSELTELMAHHSSLTPVAWHFRDHRMEVRFAPGTEPGALVDEAQRRGLRWHARDKETWVLEERQP